MQQQYGAPQPQQQYGAPQPQPVQKAKANDEGTELIVDGRLVWGSLVQKQKVNFTTKKPEFNEKGEPIMITEFGLAVPKPGPLLSNKQVDNFNKLWGAIHSEAGKQGFQYPNPNFKFKFVDGDTGKKADGSPFPSYYKGHIVIACSTRIPVKLYKWVSQTDVGPATVEDFNLGCFVQVSLMIKGHAAPNAGLYINPSMVCFYSYGEAIVASADPAAIFTTRPELPQGGSFTPIAPVFPGQQQFQQPTQGAPVMQQQYGQPQQFQQPVAQTQYVPNNEILPPQFQQQYGAPQPTQGAPVMQPQYGQPQQFQQQYGAPQPMQGAPQFPGQQG
jgi:hypothetical protein